MSAPRDRIELVKNLLIRIHKGEDVGKLKEEFREILSQVSPAEIAIIEQELIKEGISYTEILKLCDLHLALFREVLESRALANVPRGHPLDLLMRENEELAKIAEALRLYAASLKEAAAKGSGASLQSILSNIRSVLTIAKNSVRAHYRKNQMALFPFLERRGIVAIPRVLWGREDQVLVRIRDVLARVERAIDSNELGDIGKIADDLAAISNDILDLVFRENKILYPTLWALLSEGEWAAVDETARRLGYIIEVGPREWAPREPPVYPYEAIVEVDPNKIEELPMEVRGLLQAGRVEPDRYVVRREGDIELPTGFLRPEEVYAIFESLPLEITFADVNDRVRFFSESSLARGFPRAKTIIGRRIEYCHPPRLEKFVMKNVELIKSGGARYREFWTRLGDRIIRVVIVGVRDREGKLLGTLEVVEDMTDIINNPEEIKKKIVVL